MTFTVGVDGSGTIRPLSVRPQVPCPSRTRLSLEDPYGVVVWCHRQSLTRHTLRDRGGSRFRSPHPSPWFGSEVFEGTTERRTGVRRFRGETRRRFSGVALSGSDVFTLFPTSLLGTLFSEFRINYS